MAEVTICHLYYGIYHLFGLISESIILDSSCPDPCQYYLLRGSWTYKFPSTPIETISEFGFFTPLSFLG